MVKGNYHLEFQLGCTKRHESVESQGSGNVMALTTLQDCSMPSTLAAWRADVVGGKIALLHKEFTFKTFPSGRLSVSAVESNRKNLGMLTSGLGSSMTSPD